MRDTGRCFHHQGKLKPGMYLVPKDKSDADEDDASGDEFDFDRLLREMDSDPLYSSPPLPTQAPAVADDMDWASYFPALPSLPSQSPAVADDIDLASYFPTVPEQASAVADDMAWASHFPTLPTPPNQSQVVADNMAWTQFLLVNTASYSPTLPALAPALPEDPIFTAFLHDWVWQDTSNPPSAAPIAAAANSVINDDFWTAFLQYTAPTATSPLHPHLPPTASTLPAAAADWALLAWDGFTTPAATPAPLTIDPSLLSFLDDVLQPAPAPAPVGPLQQIQTQTQTQFTGLQQQIQTQPGPQFQSQASLQLASPQRQLTGLGQQLQTQPGPQIQTQPGGLQLQTQTQTQLLSPQRQSAGPHQHQKQQLQTPPETPVRAQAHKRKRGGDDEGKGEDKDKHCRVADGHASGYPDAVGLWWADEVIRLLCG